MKPSPLFRDVLVELAGLRAALAGEPATPGWLTGVAERAWRLEGHRGTHFGDGRPRPDVLIWWLAEQVRRRRWTVLKVTSYLARLGSERLGRP